MPGKTEFEQAIERQLGESIESIRKTPIDERRKMNERKYGFPTVSYLFFPLLDALVFRHNLTKMSNMN
ncbi:MAG: hypothetical protein ABI758_06430 [Candidatus Woesebacteria bacterium]